MKILFVLEHPGVGPLVPALRLLHERGHQLHLAARRVKSGHSHNELQSLADECERITYTKLPSAGGSKLAREVRLALDYRRYLEPRYRDSPKLRARAEKAAPPRLARVPGSLLRAVERSLPPPEAVLRYLRKERPDLVLVTPLIDLGSRQADWLRGAKRLGIRTGFPVFSWDNLTNKGLVRDEPDLTLVWNDLQAREAEELHGISPARIRITGAPVADPWFDWWPSRSREELCAEVGLDPSQPIVLYLCSSEFVAPNEVEFVPRWLERLRSRGGLLAGAGYLIRPYPDTAQRWVAAALDGPQVRVWPRFGEAPRDDTSRRDYFDSIYHASAVVGINTTAQIESAIVGGRCTRCSLTSSETRSREPCTFATWRRTGSGSCTSGAPGTSTPRSWRRRSAARATTDGTSDSCGASSGRSGSTGPQRRCSPTRSRSSEHGPPPHRSASRGTRRSPAGSRRGSRPAAISGRRCTSKAPPGS